MAEDAGPPRVSKNAANSYASRATEAQTLFNVALFMANVSELGFVINYWNDIRYGWRITLLALLSLMFATHVTIFILLAIIRCSDLRSSRDLPRKTAKRATMYNKHAPLSDAWKKKQPAILDPSPENLAVIDIAAGLSLNTEDVSGVAQGAPSRAVVMTALVEVLRASVPQLAQKLCVCIVPYDKMGEPPSLEDQEEVAIFTEIGRGDWMLAHASRDKRTITFTDTTGVPRTPYGTLLAVKSVLNCVSPQIFTRSDAYVLLMQAAYKLGFESDSRVAKLNITNVFATKNGFDMYYDLAGAKSDDEKQRLRTSLADYNAALMRDPRACSRPCFQRCPATEQRKQSIVSGKAQAAEDTHLAFAHLLLRPLVLLQLRGGVAELICYPASLAEAPKEVDPDEAVFAMWTAPDEFVVLKRAEAPRKITPTRRSARIRQELQYVTETRLQELWPAWKAAAPTARSITFPLPLEDSGVCALMCIVRALGTSSVAAADDVPHAEDISTWRIALAEALANADVALHPTELLDFASIERVSPPVDLTHFQLAVEFLQKDPKNPLPSLQSTGDMAALLQGLGLKHRDVRGDGNCLYRVFSMILYGTEDEHLAVRKHLWDYVRENEISLRSLRNTNPDLAELSWAAFCKLGATPGHWGDDFAMAVFSKLIRVPLLGIAPGGPRGLKLYPIGPGYDAKFSTDLGYLIGWVNENHFWFVEASPPQPPVPVLTGAPKPVPQISLLPAASAGAKPAVVSPSPPTPPRTPPVSRRGEAPSGRPEVKEPIEDVVHRQSDPEPDPDDGDSNYHEELDSPQAKPPPADGAQQKVLVGTMGGGMDILAAYYLAAILRESGVSQENITLVYINGVDLVKQLTEYMNKHQPDIPLFTVHPLGYRDRTDLNNKLDQLKLKSADGVYKFAVFIDTGGDSLAMSRDDIPWYPRRKNNQNPENGTDADVRAAIVKLVAETPNKIFIAVAAAGIDITERAWQSRVRLFRSGYNGPLDLLRPSQLLLPPAPGGLPLRVTPRTREVFLAMARTLLRGFDAKAPFRSRSCEIFVRALMGQYEDYYSSKSEKKGSKYKDPVKRSYAQLHFFDASKVAAVQKAVTLQREAAEVRQAQTEQTANASSPPTEATPLITSASEPEQPSAPLTRRAFKRAIKKPRRCGFLCFRGWRCECEDCSGIIRTNSVTRIIALALVAAQLALNAALSTFLAVGLPANLNITANTNFSELPFSTLSPASPSPVPLPTPSLPSTTVPPFTSPQPVPPLPFQSTLAPPAPSPPSHAKSKLVVELSAVGAALVVLIVLVYAVICRYRMVGRPPRRA